jgi:hypothetical protein
VPLKKLRRAVYIFHSCIQAFYMGHKLTTK